MKRYDKGFSTPLALSVIVSLCIISLSFCMISASSKKLSDSYKRNIEERKKIDSVIYNIETKIQSLKDLPSDIDEKEISSLVEDACLYDFSACDVSTGINKNFIKKEVLESKAVRDYISINNENAFVEYGWINPKFSDKKILEQAVKDFKGKNTFPLINSFPPLNIHNMEKEFIKTAFEFFGIDEAAEKTELLKETLNAETTVKEIAELLNISETHPLFELIGTKTSFWRIDFETEKTAAYAVFAAVPYKENQKKVEKYILVEKKISSRGEIL